MGLRSGSVDRSKLDDPDLRVKADLAYYLDPSPNANQENCKVDFNGSGTARAARLLRQSC